MVEETVWIDMKYVRPRLNPDKLWLIYRLVDNQHWLLRKHPHPFWNLEKVSRLRRKLLRSLNRSRKPKYQISVRERLD
jgi:hypothetical protein